MGITTIRMLVAPSAEAQAHSSSSAAERAALLTEFPGVAFVTEAHPAGSTRDRPTIDLDRWLDTSVDFVLFDAVVDELVARGPACLVAIGAEEQLLRGAWEMLTRWQRHLDRRNDSSRTPAFDGLLERLRSVHDVSKPLVRADWNHALDTWQWMLRLDPGASAAAQMAALLHDIERLESEPDARIEHLAPDYERFKTAHARRGAWIAQSLLEASGIDEHTRARVAELVESHERSTGDPDCSLLNDADALSFFSQNSPGYLDYFGAAQTARKIAYTLSRMRSGAIARLSRVRLRADVGEVLSQVRARGVAA